MSSLLIRIWTWLSPKAIYAIALLMIFGVALSLRVCLPYDNVFVGDWVRFGLNDPWYHMRLVENLVQHFPHHITFDSFTLFPYGQDMPFVPFFDLLLGFVIWVIGLGSPSQHTIEVVGAYFPAILGALVTIPVYFIGKELFNRNVGLLSAGLIAILPGEFLFRSLLGFTDHHVAEVLLSAIAALFLILAIKSAREKDTSFSHIWNRDWKHLRKPLIYALLTGLTLGVYLLSWVGALLFIFIVAAYIIIQYIVDHLSGKSTDYLCIIGLPSFLIALVMIAPVLFPPYPGKGLVIIALVIGILALLVSSGLSWLMTWRNLNRVYYPLALGGLGLAGLGVFYAIEPSLFSSMLENFGIFRPSTAARTISEVQPLLFQLGSFSLKAVWHYFTTGFFIAFISLGMIIYAIIKERSADKTFLVIWSLIMLVATLSQRRFAYYYAVNIALLCGYLSWRILEWSGLRKPSPLGEIEMGKVELEERRKKKKRKAKKEKKAGKPLKSYASYVLPVVAVVIVFFAVFYPNIGGAVNTARNPSGPDEAWHSSLLWMRDNTPEPFEDPDFYYELYDRPPTGHSYDYPESAYGVMSWWDYGHWITRIAHRIPNANPFQAGVGDAASFFTAQDESSASEILDKLGSRYVIIDYAMSTSKFYAMPTWLGESESQFFDLYYQGTSEGEMEPIRLYYPAYYQSMCARLYNFGGQAVVPENSTWVISYVEKTDEQGNKYKVISDVANDGEPFATYEEAEAYLGNQSSPNYKIVGPNPFNNPVPLEKLEHYTLVYQSSMLVRLSGNETVPYVQIFEYVP
ncbi:MAG: oligosaccharyl transferase, archaeosortase A system-associated [Dehalococcoidia bacterium]